MKFFRKNLLVLLSVMAVFLLSPTSIIRAQQMTEIQRQTLVAQLAQQIAQLQQQLTQLLAQQQASLGIPIRLTIPKINVDAKVDPVGITSSGEIGVPIGPATTSWFNLGPRPGDNGSAVISGHYGRWKNGGGSVFDDLNKLNPGDKIYVKDEKGATITFVVRELRTYGQNEHAPEVFVSGDVKAHLNLITCGGIWIPAQKTFTNRLVIFADKEYN